LSSGINLRLNTNFKVDILRVEGADSIYLGPYDFTIDAFEIYTPKIITDSSGKLIMFVGTSPVTFPVTADAHSYTPVTISNTGSADYFSVNVHDGVYSGGTTGSGHLITQEAVNKTWFIDEAVPSGSDASITLQWNASDELSGFNRSKVYLSHYTGSTWDTGNATIASGTDPYSVTRTGITSFSPFAVASSDILLPLRFHDFSAAFNNNNVLLNWHTSNELNTAYFNIQRSWDGISFKTIGKTNAKGNSAQLQSYNYVDVNVTGLKQSKLYYRLQQFDKDSKFTYSKIVSLSVYQNNTVQFSYSPNPVKANMHITLNTQENKNISIRITDVSGRQIYNERVPANAGVLNHDIDVSRLHSGIYVIEIISDNGINKSKFIKE